LHTIKSTISKPELRKQSMRKKRSLRQNIYDHLIADITSGRINAGEKLLEVDLAKKFRVSRTPVREAIFQLVKDGYVVHKKDVGAVVRKVSIQEISETFDILALLEAYAVELAARSMGSADIVQLLSQLEEMETQVKEKKYNEYLRSNILFHKFFSERCGSESLLNVIRDLRRKVHRQLYVGLTVPKYVDRYMAFHRKIYDAIQCGDAASAGVAMRRHIEENKDYILTEMSNMYGVDRQPVKR